MEIIWTRTKSIVSLCLLAVVLAGWAVKHFWFPSVDDRFFQLEYNRLQRAPDGIFILRPTHFADSTRQGCMTAWNNNGRGDQLQRFVAHNATIGQIMAAAYQCPPSRLVFPPDVPTNGFDLLVTVNKKPVERLQAAIKKKFGYVAAWQSHETDVWQLKADAGRVKVSSVGERKTEFKNGRLYFQHAQAMQLAGVLESILEKPVEDKTGLAGYYDFSIPWKWRGARADENMVKAALAETGFFIAKSTNTSQMMVVSRVK